MKQKNPILTTILHVNELNTMICQLEFVFKSKTHKPISNYRLHVGTSFPFKDTKALR